MCLQLIGGTLLTPYQELPNYTLTIENGQIRSLDRKTTEKRGDGSQAILVDGMWVIPGFIDIHVHGANGFDTMDAAPEALHSMATYFAQHGVTSYLPTTMSATRDKVMTAVRSVASTPQPKTAARHLGIHLEGPYLNPEHGGAQPVQTLRDPEPDEYHAWFESGVVRLVTLAPERRGSEELIRYAVGRGIELAVGHSGARYECVRTAADLGLRQATHTFNGMLGLHHRRPGTLGAVLTDDRIYAQVIVDLIHVHPAIVKLLVQTKGIERTILITDAMRATGLEDGDYELGGQTITVRGGEARTAAGGLAGSTLTMDMALRNLMQATSLSLKAALPMATTVPAKAMGLAGKKGALTVGADADIVVLDHDLNVRLTIVGGNIAFESLT